VPIIMNNNELKETIAALRELRKSRKEFNHTLKEVSGETKCLKRLIGDPNEKDQGSRLIAAGIALIAFPDPTISDLIGGAMVAAGLVKNRMRQATVVDVYKEFHEAFKKIEKTRREITY